LLVGTTLDAHLLRADGLIRHAMLVGHARNAGLVEAVFTIGRALVQLTARLRWFGRGHRGRRFFGNHLQGARFTATVGPQNRGTQTETRDPAYPYRADRDASGFWSASRAARHGKVLPDPTQRVNSRASAAAKPFGYLFKYA